MRTAINNGNRAQIVLRASGHIGWISDTAIDWEYDQGDLFDLWSMVELLNEIF